MLADLCETRGDLVRRKHQVDGAAGNRALRHAAMLRRVFVLRERQASGRLDLADPEGAVRARAGQNHADRVLALDRGKRPQEVVHGIVRPPIVGTRRDAEHTVRDRDAGVRLNDVDVVRRDLDTIAGLDDGHRGVWPQQIGEMAGVRGIQVLDHDQREPRPGRQRGEELVRSAPSPPAEAPTPTMGNGFSAGAAMSRV